MICRVFSYWNTGALRACAKIATHRRQDRRRSVALAALALCLLSSAAWAQKAPLAEEVFKNVQVLKGIPADQFMDTMGVFSAALGMSCEDCHAANDSKWENYALDNSPRKQTTRRMVTMMSGINKSYFGGAQVVTCYSCHRGSDRPKVTVSLARLYGATSEEEEDDVIPAAPDAPSADSIFDKYLAALGGAERLRAITSFAARGTSSGYGPESEKRMIEIYAKAPAQRTTIIHTANGDSTTAFDGRDGWIAAPLRPIAVLAMTGGDLEGLRLDAELSFPAAIKKAFPRWRVGRPGIIDDRRMQVVQGAGAAGSMATFYFDPDSGLLVRMIRYANSPVGRVPTQYDYSDYREVSGVKMPFRWTMTWLDGRENVELSDVRVNASIDAGKFAKPASGR